MIQKIQAFEIPGKGTATESKIEVQSRFTTGDRAIIYYDLRDPRGTTPALDLSTQNYVTLPYAILSRSLIIATGEDLAAVVADSKFAVDIVFRKRKDITKESDRSTLKYFAVRNKMSQSGRRSGRRNIDRGAYSLYEKPSAAKAGLNSYTLLSESAGEPVRVPIYGPKGELIGYEDRPLSNNYGAGIIDVEVTTSSTGEKTYAVAPNSRGDEFYINIIQPYL